MSGREARVRLVICRHTQTDDNVQNIYSGQNDVLLNEVGLEQARLLAQKIVASFSVKQILCSDLLRSLAVAHEIARACGELPPITHSEDLREVHVGRMTGLTKTDALVQFPERRHRSSNANYDYQDIGGECADDVAFRMMHVIDNEAFRLRKQYQDVLPTIVLVGHGTALRTVFTDRLRAFHKLHAQGDFQVCEWYIGQL